MIAGADKHCQIDHVRPGTARQTVTISVGSLTRSTCDPQRGYAFPGQRTTKGTDANLQEARNMAQRSGSLRAVDWDGAASAGEKAGR